MLELKLFFHILNRREQSLRRYGMIEEDIYAKELGETEKLRGKEDRK